MPGIEIKGRSKIANYRHGGRTGKSNKFDTWETIGIPGSPGPHKGKYPAIDKVMKNIEKQKKKGIKEPGYDPDFKAAGGRTRKAGGGWTLRKPVQKLLEGIGGGSEKKPHSTRAGRISAGVRKIKRGVKKAKREDKAEGGRIGLKKGGSDKKWIQKAVNPKHKGYCTPMTKKTCTPARKALARTFKKKAKTGWG